jgi:hypothetical protein
VLCRGVIAKVVLVRGSGEMRVVFAVARERRSLVCTFGFGLGLD